MDQPENDRDDARAVRRTLQGEREAFAVIVRRYQGPIYRLMLRFSRDEHAALELAQEAFVKAFERLGTYDPGRRFFTWFYTLALNLARDQARRGRRDPVGRPAIEPVATAVTGDPVARLERTRLIEALRSLPSKYGEALALRYIEGLSLEEVAETLGLSTSGAKMRVHRGLGLLRERYGEEE